MRVVAIQMVLHGTVPVAATWHNAGPAKAVTTCGYNVVMTHPVSVRFRDPATVDRLRKEADARGQSSSSLAEELIEEGLRLRRHPLIVFRSGPAGRRAAVVGGPDVWEVVGGLVGGDVPVDDRVDRVEEVFGLRREQVDAVLAYYAEFAEEVDEQLAANLAAADEAEALWHRQRELLAS